MSVSEDCRPPWQPTPIRLRTDEPSGTLEIRRELAALQPDKTTGRVQARVRVVGTASIGSREVVRAGQTLRQSHWVAVELPPSRPSGATPGFSYQITPRPALRSP